MESGAGSRSRRPRRHPGTGDEGGPVQLGPLVEVSQASEQLLLVHAQRDTVEALLSGGLLAYYPQVAARLVFFFFSV